MVKALTKGGRCKRGQQHSSTTFSFVTSNRMARYTIQTTHSMRELAGSFRAAPKLTVRSIACPKCDIWLWNATVVCVAMCGFQAICTQPTSHTHHEPIAEYWDRVKCESQSAATAMRTEQQTNLYSIGNPLTQNVCIYRAPVPRFAPYTHTHTWYVQGDTRYVLSSVVTAIREIVYLLFGIQLCGG